MKWSTYECLLFRSRQTLKVCRGWSTGNYFHIECSIMLMKCTEGNKDQWPVNVWAEYTPSWVAGARDKLPGQQQPCLDWLCWAAESVSSTPAADLYQLCRPAGHPPTHSPGRRRSRSCLAPSWTQRTREEQLCFDRCRVQHRPQDAHLKGASATALVVIAT